MSRWIVVGALLATGCGEVTEIVVEVDTDLAGAERFRVDATLPDGTTQTSTAELADRPPPRRLVLLHETGPLAPVRLDVRALGARDATLGVTSRELAFEANASRVLRVHLGAGCAAASCPAGQTCGNDGACRDTAVRPCELWPEGCADAGPARDAGMDAGPRDAGLDAGRADAGPRDAGVRDASAPVCPGAPCGATLTCDPRCDCNSSCALQCMPDLDCQANCIDNGACAVDARRSDTVNLVCSTGAVCNVWAQGANSVTATVDDGGDLDLDCTGAQQCVVNCNNGSCRVDCTGVPTGQCQLLGCSPSMCPGDVLVCSGGC